MLSCTVLVSMIVEDEDCTDETAVHAASVASVADSLLEGHELKLGILLHEPLYLGQGAVPPAEVLRPLAKYLWRFDFCNVAPELAPPRNNNRTYAPPVTPQQLDAMSHGSLCQLTANIEPPTAAFNPASSIWSALHSLPNLQQLHLTFHNKVSHSTPRFEPLSSLVSLVDLALQSHSHDAVCGLVLNSSKSTLRQITLTARSWKAETYRCLSRIPQLEELCLSITDLMGMETYWLLQVSCLHVQANFGQRGSISLEHPDLPDRRLMIHKLTTWYPCWNMLHSLPGLQDLTIVNCSRGCDRHGMMPLCTNSLTFAGKFGIQSSSTLGHVLTNLYALRVVSFCASPDSCTDTAPICSNAVKL